MAWFKKKPTPPFDPLTPWEQYQEKREQTQQHQASSRQPFAMHLPKVEQLRASSRKRNVALVLTPLLILLAFFSYMASPLAKVGPVLVNGVQTVPGQYVIDASQLTGDSTILGLLGKKRQVIDRIVKQVPQVKQAQLQVSQLNHVTITVKEHRPVGYVLANKQYHAILGDGQVLKSGSAAPKYRYPIFTGFKNAEAASLAKALSGLPDAVFQSISEITATRGAGNPYQVSLLMTDGNHVVADRRTLAKKMKHYPEMVAQVKAPGTLDLEVGAFFTPKAELKASSKK